MKVLQLGKYYYPYMGGIENHLYLLCNEIKRSVDLEVVVCNSRPREDRDVVDGVSVRRCLEVANAASVSICPTMPLVLSRRHYDILHLHYPHPMGVMSYLASIKPRNHKVIITYHSDIVKQETLLKAYAPFMREVMARASAIICTSPNYLASSTALQEFREKCVVIPYGIDVAQFAKTPAVERQAAEIRERFKGPLVLGTGRLIYYKGFEYAIRAMRDIDASLLLIGDGPLRVPLEALARECGVSDRVHFLGEIDNRQITAYYFACDLFILPSIARSEAFAIVQLEAMACGRAIVNTSLDSGVPFVSRHDESGLTVRPKDAEDLSRAVNRLLDSRELRSALGARGRARVEAEFSKEVMATRVRETYRQALEFGGSNGAIGLPANTI
jgi:glycosyltransferase involved in cell wall biosynthesis